LSISQPSRNKLTEMGKSSSICRVPAKRFARRQTDEDKKQLAESSSAGCQAAATATPAHVINETGELLFKEPSKFTGVALSYEDENDYEQINSPIKVEENHHRRRESASSEKQIRKGKSFGRSRSGRSYEFKTGKMGGGGGGDVDNSDNESRNLVQKTSHARAASRGDVNNAPTSASHHRRLSNSSTRTGGGGGGGKTRKSLNDLAYEQSKSAHSRCRRLSQEHLSDHETTMDECDVMNEMEKRRQVRRRK
jgi:hypothetical protein